MDGTTRTRPRVSPLRAAAAAALMGMIGAAAPLAAGAGEVVMFRGQAPSADELADIMFPQPQQERQADLPPGVRVRGIRFTEPAPQQQATPQQQQQQQQPAPQQQAAVPAAPSQQQQPSGFGFNINFALNSAELLPDTLPYLDRVGEMLNLEQARGQAIVIAGHTDASGSDEYNQRLSERRALAVAGYLAERHGVAPERMRVVGFGERQPLPGTAPMDGVNRRVEFHPAN